MAFPPPRGTLVARRTAEVAPVLEAVDAATRAGEWAVGYVAYEAASGLDRALMTAPPTSDGPPLAWFALTGPPVAVEPVTVPAPDRYRAGPWLLDRPEVEYLRAVEVVREAIEAGEIFQGNLTTRLHATVTGDLAAFYADLALNQRPRFAALLELDDLVIVSASPELFFRWQGGELLTRPMKGTAPRGRTPGEDAGRRAALLASSKERAENVIVVDLLRNDVGRVATTGTVRADVLCRAERYDTVWQLTSDVSGAVPPPTPLVDVFRALFPCGSVTGAPKPRAVEVLRGVENGPRGIYCGAVGWVAPPEAPVRATFSVAIRTAVVDRRTGEASYGAGGGITWSSDPEAELAEVRAKAAILARPYREFALLETFAARAGDGIPRLERHLARLAASASHLGFAYDEARIRDVLRDVRGDVDLRVRLALHRDGRVELTCRPFPRPPGGPVRLAVDDQPVDPSCWELFHKSTLRDVYEQAASRHPEADDVVLVNGGGEVTETTIATLAVRCDGRWCTPPVDSGCLPGVERGRLLELGVLSERRLTVDDLRAADGLAVVNSLRGWRDAVLL